MHLIADIPRSADGALPLLPWLENNVPGIELNGEFVILGSYFYQGDPDIGGHFLQV